MENVPANNSTERCLAIALNLPILEIIFCSYLEGKRELF